MDDSDARTEMDTKGDSDIKTESITTSGFYYAMKILRGKYKLAVLYTLRKFHVVRFNDMRRYMRTLTYRTLSTTLKELQDDGLVLRAEYAQVPPRVEYSLTDRGKTLCPILDALNAWGEENQLPEAQAGLEEEEKAALEKTAETKNANAAAAKNETAEDKTTESERAEVKIMPATTAQAKTLREDFEHIWKSL